MRKWEGLNVRRGECAQVGRGDLFRGISQKANHGANLLKGKGLFRLRMGQDTVVLCLGFVFWWDGKI